MEDRALSGRILTLTLNPTVDIACEADAVRAVRRARPVLLTALAAVLAFVPLTHSVFWGPMAVAMIGGLTLATLATLLVVPALYGLALGRRPRRRAAGELSVGGALVAGE